MKKLVYIEGLVLVFVLAVVMGYRLMHMTGPLTDPSWRPATTSYMAYRMAQESPPDILHPKVVYRGGRDIRASEFPLYPFVVALVYKAMNVDESLPAARTVTLLSYLGMAVYLYLILARLFNRRVAWYGAVVLLMLPLGIFYSRAVHYDVPLLFFSVGFFYHAILFCEEKGWGQFITATLMATAAFLMKAPYCYYFGFPLLVIMFYRREDWTLRNFVLLGCLFVLPLVAAIWFNLHRIAIEGNEPQSILLAQKWTGDSQSSWFFGDLSLRVDLASWIMVIRRTVYSVLTPLGTFAAALVFFLPWRKENRKGWLAVLALCFGIFTYIVLIFPMIASLHDYYSIPLLVPAAILIALFLEWVIGANEPGGINGKGVVRFAITMLLLLMCCFYGIKKGPTLFGLPYFHTDWHRVLAGQVIKEHTEPEDLVLVTTKGRHIGETDPKINSYAKRRGWGRDFSVLTEKDIEIVRAADATHVAMLITPPHEPTEETMGFLTRFPHEVYPLEREGEVIGYLALFELRESEEPVDRP